MFSKVLVVAMTLAAVYSENSGSLNHYTASASLRGLTCTAEGRFPVPDDCGQFYDCVPSGDNGSLVAYLSSCFGNAYNASLKVCVPIQLAKGCTPRSVRSFTADADPMLQHVCNNTQDHMWCENCKSLVMCIDGNPHTKLCEYGTVCSEKKSYGGGVCYPEGVAECTCNKTNSFQRDFYDNSTYLYCGTEGSDPIIHTCSDGLVFNEERRACVTKIEETCTAPGIFAVKDDCNRYIVCIFDKGVWLHREFTCQNKTMFNEKTGKCEDPCLWYSGHFKCKAEGRFMNPTDCRKFYICFADPLDNNRLSWVEEECPKGYEWNQTKTGVGVCVKNGTANKQCESLKATKCRIPYDWCTSVAVTIRNVTSYSVEVDWSQKFYYPYDITNYTIKWVKSSGEEETAVATELSYDITNLTACTNYTITVTAYTERGEGEQSENITLLTGIDVAGKSRNVTSTSATSFSVEIGWTPPLVSTCITNYTVKCVRCIDGASHEFTVNESPYNLTGLTPCTEYNISIIAFTELGAGEPSDIVTLTTGMYDAGKSSNIRSKRNTSFSLEVLWTPANDSTCITKYALWVSKSSGEGKRMEFIATDPSYNITGLSPCTEYNINVFDIINETIVASSDTIILTTGMYGAGKSSNVSSKSFTSHSLEVDWTLPNVSSCITNYTVKYVRHSDGDSQEYNVTEPPYNITGLTPCTDYNITVIAYTDEGAGDPSDNVTLTTGTDAAGKSGNVSSKSFTSHSLEVDWSPPLDSICVRNYTVQWVSSRDGVSHNITVTEPPYNITDLLPCTNYNISVIAFTEEGAGEASDNVTLTTGMYGAGISSNVSSISFTANSLEVNWTLPNVSTCVTNYTVKLVNRSDGESQDYTATEPPYNITGLTPCTEYNISVIANTKEGAGNASDTVTLTTGTDGAGKSSNVRCKHFTSLSLDVDWTPPMVSTCVTNYTVNLIKLSDGASQNYTATKHPYYIAGLTSCTEYNLSVITNTEEGAVEPSDTVTLTTGAGKSSNVSSISFTSTSLEVNWTLPNVSTCITNYTIKCSDCPRQEYNVTEPPFNITGLIPCTDYNISVIANTKDGAGDSSDNVTLTTGVEGAEKSSNVSRISFTSHSLEVNWTPPNISTCITNYTIKCSDCPSQEYNVTEPPYNITDLIPCTDYNISVIANTMKGAGDSSDNVTLTTGVEGARESSNVRTKSITTHSLEVDWTPPSVSTCVTNYTVMLVKLRDGASLNYTATEPAFNITDLTPCTWYNISVIANTMKGAGNSSDTVTLETGVDVPGKPSNLRVDPQSGEIEWNKPVDNTCHITKYNVVWIKLSSKVRHEITVISSKKPPHFIPDLNPCADYGITVTAYTEKGPGVPTDTYTLSRGITDGFEVYNYRLIRRTNATDPKLSWDDAMTFCNKYNAIPWIPRTARDYRLYKDSQIAIGARLWLPAYDREEEGTLEWHSGERDDDTSWQWLLDNKMSDNSEENDCLMYEWCSHGFCGARLHQCTEKMLPPICGKSCS